MSGAYYGNEPTREETLAHLSTFLRNLRRRRDIHKDGPECRRLERHIDVMQAAYECCMKNWITKQWGR